ncbi:hypothetical protein CPB86DRAFT_706003 [Serendipita vermifera]|nr:hypothetical protein CPB86DRAFT_706003 [Serendipita vermifera]
MKKNLSTLDLSHLYTIAMAQNEIFRYVVFIWNAGYLFRKKAKLGSYPIFAIPVSGQKRSGFQPQVEDILPSFNPQQLGIDVLDHLSFALLHAQKEHQALQVATTLAQKEPVSFRGWLRLADVAFKLGYHKLAMLAYGRILSLQGASAKVRSHALDRIMATASYTEWSHIFLKGEIDQLPPSLHAPLLETWSNEVRDEISDLYGSSIGSRWETKEPLYLFSTSEDLDDYALPLHFRWLVPFRLAISSAPSDERRFQNLYSTCVDIRHLVILDDRSNVNEEWVRSFKQTYVPMHTMRVPTLEQIDCIMDSVSAFQQLPTLIYSSDPEITAVVAACYLVAHGFSQAQTDRTTPAIQASDAISALDAFHPLSIRKPEQENIVTLWERCIWKRNSVIRVSPMEPPPCPLEIIGEVPPDADLFLLVGLQGSGKSYFARALRARKPNGWKRVSQDESGSRALCETDVGRDPMGKKVLLDRCNPTSKDRESWRRLAHWSSKPVIVWFDYPKDICVARAQKRLEHPTLPPGPRVNTAVTSTHAQFEPPIHPTKEGFLGTVIIRSFNACQELISLLSPPVELFKFPRTAHLLNLGAATEDDLHHTPSHGSSLSPSLALESGSRIIITEKIDGANVGFSLNENSGIVVQNRSHWVNSKTHFQFKRLDLWVEEHREDLYHILAVDDMFPQRFVLFGEWMVCVHSINYTSLPSEFLIFDLYDRVTASFASRDVLEAKVKGTKLHIVPMMEMRQNSPEYSEGQLTLPSDEELRLMVQRPSQFYSGRVEGIYVKVERGGRVVHRGKVVRGDFIAGNEHWTKGPLTLNGIVKVSVSIVFCGNM